jgi:hypothetical protein
MLSTAIRFGAMVATEAIARQMREYEQRRGTGRATDHAMRFAVDDFIVGYAVGIAMRHTQTEGAVHVDAPIEALLAELQSRLATVLPNLDVESTYRGGSARLAAGIFFGLHERGDKAGALLHVYESMSRLALAPEAYLRQFAYEYGADSRQGLLVQAACEEMRARYGSGASAE